MVEAKVLELAERRIIDDDLATHVPLVAATGPLADRAAHGECIRVPAVQLSYVDDAVFAATDKHPGRLLQKVTAVATT
eukprot:9887578-Lingulodinium_polyedra.AAC.1